VDAALINGVTRSREELVSVAIGADDVIPLMFPTGYLTIASYDSRRFRYELRFPNREVEIGFAKNLLPLYAPKTQNPDGPFGIYSFQDDLDEGRPEDFIKRLATLIKDIPYEMHDESVYQSIAYLVCLLSGTEPRAEQHSYRGRSDLEVHTQDYIYIFEFKFNGSAEEAIAQIRNRDYAGRYAFDPRGIYIIGANFSDRKPERGLDAYIIEKIK
ncbi:MAG: PD-(D/E)XK nuclease domain-containing protein, partial [Muribaculaceae bacterium]|nr:PD-(D/E)XK nuclease domain-containing protein [Muribaculaceae bacterium]